MWAFWGGDISVTCTTNLKHCIMKTQHIVQYDSVGHNVQHDSVDHTVQYDSVGRSV